MYKYTKNSRALIPEKLHHCQRSKKGFSWHVISIITKNRPHAHHKSHLHTMKVYNTQPVSLLLIKFSFFSTTEAFTCSKIFQSNQCFQAIEFIDRRILHKTCMALVTQRFLFPVSTVSTRNASGTTTVVLCTKYEEKNPLADYESCCLG